MEKETIFMSPEEVEKIPTTSVQELENIPGRKAVKEELKCIKDRSSFLSFCSGIKTTIFALIFGIAISVISLIKGRDLQEIFITFATILVIGLVFDIVSYITRLLIYTNKEKLLLKAFKSKNYEILDAEVEIISEKLEREKYSIYTSYVAFKVGENTYYWYECVGNRNYEDGYFIVRFKTEEGPVYMMYTMS